MSKPTSLSTPFFAAAIVVLCFLSLTSCGSDTNTPADTASSDTSSSVALETQVAVPTTPPLVVEGASDAASTSQDSASASQAGAFGGNSSSGDAGVSGHGAATEPAGEVDEGSEAALYIDPTEGSIDGAVIYEAHCARCHGADGTGGAGSDISQIGQMLQVPTPLVGLLTNGGVAMPGFGNTLSDEQIAAVAQWIIDEFN